MKTFNTIIYVDATVEGGHMIGETNPDGIIESFSPVTLDAIISAEENILYYVMVQEESNGDITVQNIQQYRVESRLPTNGALILRDTLDSDDLLSIANDIMENHRVINRKLH